MDWQSKYLNKITCINCLEGLSDLPDNIIDLCVTSPPYNVGKDYGESYNDRSSAQDYFSFLEKVFVELFRVTKVGGRLCLNVPFIGNSYFLKKSTHLQFYPLPYIELLQKVEFTFRDFVIWVKSKKAEDPNNFSGNSTQWGSWLSPSSPYLRCFAEAILIFHKKDKKLRHKGQTDLTKEEFLTWTKNIWYFPAESKRKHPAPFPLELPKRCIKLYTYVGDLVIDPFVGWGTTALAAKKLKRNFIAFEINKNFSEMATQRLKEDDQLKFHELAI